MSFETFYRRHAAGRAGSCQILLAVIVGFSLVSTSTAIGGDDGRDRSGPPRETTITRVQTNTDGDYVPDRVGDTIVVRGRASVRRGALPDSSLVFVQDGTAGIAVHLPNAEDVRRGDSLRVRGVVQHNYGLTRLHGLDVAQIEALPREPEPFPLTVSATVGETYEGRLVEVRGRVVANRTNDGGAYLLLEDDSRNAAARVAVFVPKRRLDRVDLSDFEAGERAVVTGVLSQHDYSAPFDDYYQVLPRDQQDLEKSGLVSGYYHTIIILIVAGALLAVIAVFTLRAAVRRRTQELAESRARFRRLAEATFEGIILHENGEVLDVNRALTDMIGYDRDDLVGGSVFDVLSESTRSLVETRIADRTEETYEVVMVRKDGSTFPAEVEEKVVDPTERNIRVAAIRNVTERKERETELLLAKEEAEEMARLKTSLLNNMSHEFRTPITSIIGYTELILEEPNEDHQKFATRIRQSAKRLSRTLRAVLEMAQVESGTLNVQEEEVAIRPLIRDVVKEYGSMADESGLSLEVVRADQGTVATDRVLLSRILGNIVHNGVKFTDEGIVEIEATATDHGIQIRVSDPGIGIDPEFRPKLFEPFKQESEGRTRTYEGTGLGLALTKRMLDLLGGSIEVQSTKGKGSTFIVAVPSMHARDEGVHHGSEVEAA